MRNLPEIRVCLLSGINTKRIDSPHHTFMTFVILAHRVYLSIDVGKPKEEAALKDYVKFMAQHTKHFQQDGVLFFNREILFPVF